MSLLDAYRQKLEAQIQEQKANLELLKAKARKAAANGKILGYEELAKADKHLDQIKAKAKELASAGGDALTEIRGGLSKAFTDLKLSTRKAADHLGAHTATPPPPKARRRAKPSKSKASPRPAATKVKTKPQTARRKGAIHPVKKSAGPRAKSTVSAKGSRAKRHGK